MNGLVDRFLAAPEDMFLDGATAADLDAAARELADHPYGGDLFVALCRSGTEACHAAAETLVRTTRDPGVMTEIVRGLARGLPLGDGTARRFLRAFLERAEDGSSHYGIRSQALLGALYLSQGQDSLVRRLQAHLLDITIDDEGNYLRHAARIIGTVLAHVDDPSLLAVLVNLLDVAEARDEAAMALGRLALAEALDETDRGRALDGFRAARSRFGQSIAASEGRLDATLYLRCLDVLLGFHDASDRGRLTERIAGIHAAAFEVAAFLLPSDRPVDRDTWLGMASLESLHWSSLALRLAALDTSLAKDAWLSAARVIEEELVLIHSASQSILRRSRDGGIEALVRPRIVGELQRNRVQLALLDQWIAERQDTGALPGAVAIRASVAQAMEASLLGNPPNAVATNFTATAIIEASGWDEARRAEATRLLRDSLVSLELEVTAPIVIEIWHEMRDGMLSNPDYASNPAARQFFDMIVFHTIGFVHSRENVSGTSTNGTEYLFAQRGDKEPVEEDLHRDYYGYLQATPLRELCLKEVEGVGHGRADVFFFNQAIRTVAELKKTDRDRTLDGLVERYALQSTAYQRTQVRFCILMVLDLVDRGGSGGHLRELVGVRRKTPTAGRTTYWVVAFRVQGRKRPPSKVAGI
ncbi:hypothetical protein [Microvirga tunisiensis]|uniref:Uncharacterized protein n=1 Tax=Microvirga tunisiensis TaxID=2108360 RepID=A0A5N7MQ05_9HYPH|nr:hypothetical protein [Microvirga tunisiensis]MPR06191.1 hypothetical protein [Microvirga tunisiensis]MPR26066.1 hypothetical protein [Microvirga tunisiensis]